MCGSALTPHSCAESDMLLTAILQQLHNLERCCHDILGLVCNT
jgi:hypothetical protein